jgi:hypothetical protein
MPSKSGHYVVGNSVCVCVYEGISKSFRTESITKYTLTTINTCWEATQRVMAAKLTRLTHKMAIQLHIVAESCNICSSRSRRPVRKLLDTPSCTQCWGEHLDTRKWEVIDEWRKLHNVKLHKIPIYRLLLEWLCQDEWDVWDTHHTSGKLEMVA